MEIKKPTTIEEQLEKIEARGCLIEDREFAKNILSQINYYRLTSYFLSFRTEDDSYKENTSFEKVYKLYVFDKKLRSLISMEIETVEMLFRMQISYHHSHKYGGLGYLDPSNFNDKCDHVKFMESINKLITRNENNPIVKHHKSNYDGKFPLWVMIELFDFGLLSRFYSDMIMEDKKAIANSIGTTNDILISWLYCLNHLRNCCAHYARLYNTLMISVPRTPINFEYVFKKTIFNYLVVIKLLVGNTEEWKNNFIPSLESLIEEYKDVVDISLLGFRINWLEILSSGVKYINK